MRLTRIGSPPAPPPSAQPSTAPPVAQPPITPPPGFPPVHPGAPAPPATPPWLASPAPLDRPEELTQVLAPVPADPPPWLSPAAEFTPARSGAPADPPDDGVLSPNGRPLPQRHRRVSFNPSSTTLTAIRSAGEVMITLGLVLLLFAAYEVWGKAAIVGAHQEVLDQQLSEEWSAPPVVAPSPGATPSPEPAAAAPPPGWAIARLHIPRLNKHWVVVEGVDLSDIKYAPGHYPDTAMPGQVGNFAVAGHRSPAIFWDLDKLSARDPNVVEDGDTIVVETRTNYYVYAVTRNYVVLPSAIEVIAPVPGSPGQAATSPMLTLTTCNPKWDNYERLIVHARLIRSLARADGPPPELTAG